LCIKPRDDVRFATFAELLMTVLTPPLFGFFFFDCGFIPSAVFLIGPLPLFLQERTRRPSFSTFASPKPAVSALPPLPSLAGIVQWPHEVTKKSHLARSPLSPSQIMGGLRAASTLYAALSSSSSRTGLGVPHLFLLKSPQPPPPNQQTGPTCPLLFSSFFWLKQGLLYLLISLHAAA